MSMLFLLFGAACLFTFAATLDPFLNLWDERFHALVAKNFLQHPFVPTLYDNPVVNTNYDHWDRYHIWFHKQPLFLWQIAMSFKLFGISEYTLRIPNVIMGVVLTLIVYRSGERLVNLRVGLMAAILFCTSHRILELASGRSGLDHNDFAFLFYISLSIWAYIEYHFSRERKWLIAIGLFSGCAILCKWLVGLLVYFGWGVLRLFSKQFSILKNKDLLLSLSITLLVALPWQIYEFVCYPVEAAKEYSFYAEHFSKPLDGHSGPWYYHLSLIPDIYNFLGALFLIPALIFFRNRFKDKSIFWYFFSNIMVVYVFFSFAQTRMPAFTIILFLMISIILASFYELALSKIETQKPLLNKLIFSLFIVILVFVNLKIEAFQAKHTSWKSVYPDREILINNRQIFQDLTPSLDENSVLFNVKGRHYIECMFYTNKPCYNFIPSQDQYDDLKRNNNKIVLFNSEREALPNYLQDDASIHIVREAIKGYD